eukprot:Protomagalhaensia_sp_Gyna_25__1928@NODE_2023_length_1339_cov_615_240769_g1453_i1_p1_GENE_NODE_2023_length_1339_cov_615_240769_g1453_i1NODE_2023_length_1339_cov_615_240769_g1453_i1_p1_ORF_typecomplete_len140_score16_66Aminotran_3/PF00202_21/8e15_NODE_2023_length_1339_cov_615_240769_g1453_i18851304
MEALNVLQEEKLAENSQKMGEVFRSKMNALKEKNPKLISTVRGKGLLNAVVINQATDSPMAWNMWVEMAQNGTLAKPTHGNIIRLSRWLNSQLKSNGSTSYPEPAPLLEVCSNYIHSVFMCDGVYCFPMSITSIHFVAC